jgi:hypothetical protein
MSNVVGEIQVYRTPGTPIDLYEGARKDYEEGFASKNVICKRHGIQIRQLNQWIRDRGWVRRGVGEQIQNPPKVIPTKSIDIMGDRAKGDLMDKNVATWACIASEALIRIPPELFLPEAQRVRVLVDTILRVMTRHQSEEGDKGPIKVPRGMFAQFNIGNLVASGGEQGDKGQPDPVTVDVEPAAQ